jgi:hypothetical protein
VILSSFELASAEIRKAAEQRAAQQQAREALTPQHAACEAAVDGGDDEAARERARRVQHLADPAAPDLGKALGDAYLPPADYPQPARVSPEDFRRGPTTDRQAALSPGYEPPLSFPLMPDPQPSQAGWSLAAPPPAGPYVSGGDCP